MGECRQPNVSKHANILIEIANPDYFGRANTKPWNIMPIPISIEQHLGDYKNTKLLIVQLLFEGILNGFVWFNL